MYNIFKDENGQYVVFNEDYRKGFPTYGEAVQHINKLTYTYEIEPSGEKFDVYEVWTGRIRDYIGTYADEQSALAFIERQRAHRNMC